MEIEQPFGIRAFDWTEDLRGSLGFGICLQSIHMGRTEALIEYLEPESLVFKTQRAVKMEISCVVVNLGPVSSLRISFGRQGLIICDKIRSNLIR